MKLKEMWSKILKRNRKNYSSEICLRLYLKKGFSGGSDGKESETCLQCGRWFEPWVRKSPGEGNDYPLQQSSLENSTDRGAWWVTDMGSQKV